MPLTIFQEDLDAATKAVSKVQAYAIDLRDEIASAIAAQREKSAKIAESHTREHGAVAKQIAALIRKNRFE